MPAEVDPDRSVLARQEPGERVEHPGAEAVGVQEHERRAVAAPVERADGATVVLDGPLLRVDGGRGHPAHATRTPRALRLAGSPRVLGILPIMPTAAGTRLRCEQCETEIIVVKGTDGEVSCCGQPMATREG